MDTDRPWNTPMRAALLTALVLALAPAAEAASLCAPGETEAFACPVGRKSVAVCIGRSADPARAGVAYVYGVPGKVELRLPASGRAGVTRGTVAYSGGGADYLRFRNGAHDYVVYSGIGRGWEQDGLYITRGGRPIGDMVCKSPGTGPDGFGPIYAAKLPEDTGSFEVPVR